MINKLDKWVLYITIVIMYNLIKNYIEFDLHIFDAVFFFFAYYILGTFERYKVDKR